VLDIATSGLTREVVEELARQRGEPEWLLRLRLEAFTTYEQLPVPTPQTEGWRRTRLSGLQLKEQSALGEIVVTHALGSTDSRVVVMDLAEAARDAQLGPRVRAHFGRVVVPGSDKFTALHYAFFNSGVLVYVPRGAAIESVLHVVHEVSQPGLGAFVHTLVLLEDEAELSLMDDQSSTARDGSPVASGVVEMVLGQNAHLRYVNLQRWAPNDWAFSWQRARLANDANLRILNAALGGRLIRDTVHVMLDGRGSQADLLGVVAITGHQHVDLQTLQEHSGDATRSDLFIHNALRERSSSTFTGLIRINTTAHQTESSQEQKNFLLSTQANANSDPKLEILNNDVIRCTHGAAVGPVDADLIFYLQSRGLSRDTAERLVLEGFFQSVLEKLAQPDLQAAVWSLIDEASK
jgi:Fe-S cluster assembly protein SufD